VCGTRPHLLRAQQPLLCYQLRFCQVALQQQGLPQEGERVVGRKVQDPGDVEVSHTCAYLFVCVCVFLCVFTCVGERDTHMQRSRDAERAVEWVIV
jgi:hypothetical protein